mmetsp:Transcript_27844/g.24476  ORF Transcript_27844/g.24476 Transcript_27844/m.24476 type:complete len:185 (-) Transcript_27844:435-989(-)
MENQGGSGSSGSHWERKYFLNEFMTASTFRDNRVSIFTLALLDSTGWYYDVDYSMAEPFVWGKDAGCRFFEEKCYDSETMTANFPEFCDVLGTEGCSYNRREQAYCGNVGYPVDKSLNPEFNYWKNFTIVNDHYSDNCPYYRAYYNGDCWNVDNKNIGQVAEEKYGYDSACFTGTLGYSYAASY